MKSVIVEGPNAVPTALGWTADATKPILSVIDLAPAHVEDVRVVFGNDFDADEALKLPGQGWVVLHDSFPKYGFAGTVLYAHPDTPKPM